MDFLNSQEKIQLQRILAKSSQLQTSDERRNFLIFCGLEDSCGLVQLDLPCSNFIISIFAQLSKVYITVENSEKLGLIVFLEYISQIEISLSTEDKYFIKYVITQWEQLQASSESEAQETRSENVLIIHPRRDWGDAPDVPVFFGRTEELATLEQWIVKERCRLVAILGMGGIGKTALSVKLAQQIQSNFEYIIWRSLRNAPSVKDILAELIKFLSDQQEILLPETVDGRISLLIDYCRQHRCLLVLDNAEAILRGGDRAGYYRESYEGYGELLRRVGETSSRSCLVLTSREKPKEIDRLEGETGPVRSLQLTGLEEEAQEILQGKGLSGSKEEFRRLIDFYQGNPLALQIVPATIKRVFKGSISKFLETETAVFGDIRDLLEEQFNRLSNLEKEVMYWLAINREPLSLTDLEEDIVSPVALRELIEALDSLGRRSLLQENEAGFTQQSVIMEYIVDRLIESVCNEIKTLQIELFNRHTLLKATAKNYVRETQVRLILKSVFTRLLTEYGSAENLEYQMTQILSIVREKTLQKTGYAGGNILNLLVQIKTTLRGYDFSNLVVWQAYLQDVNLHHTNFSHCDLAKSVFTETFGTILSVAFSADGKSLAVGDVIGEIRLWEITDGQKLFITCKGHTNWIWSVAFSSDNQILASGSDDQTVKLWDTNTGQCLKTFQGHTSRVKSIAFDPQGKTLASASEDQTLRLWDISTGQCLKTLHGHTNWVQSVAFSPDGQTLASGSTDQTVKLWDTSTGQCLETFQGHSNWVQSVAFSPDGKTLVSGSDDCTIRVWNVSNGQCLKILEVYNHQVRSVAFSSQGTTVASGSTDRTVRLWDVTTGQCLKALQGHMSWVRSVAFSPDSQILATGSDDRTVKLWDVTTGQCIKIWQGYTNWVWSVAFSPDGQILASGSEDKAVRLWDTSTGQCLKTLHGHTNWIHSVAFSPDGKILVSGSDDHTVRVWNVSNGQCLKILEDHSYQVRSVAFSSQGTTVASSSTDHTVKIWDINTGQCLKTLHGHTNWVQSVAFSPDGQTLVSSGADSTVRLWDISTGECLNILQGHTNRVRAVSFSPQGTTVASGSADCTVRLWDISTGECLNILQGHTSWVQSVAFSPDGRTLISGSTDRTVRLWDISTSECLNIFQGHSNSVRTVAFSPDSQTIASCSDDETVKLWNLNQCTCVNTLRASRPYEGMNIINVTGLTEAQKSNLEALGAITK